MKNRPGLLQLGHWVHLLAMPTGSQRLWIHHKAPGNFTAGKAGESLPRLLSGGRHALKRGREHIWEDALQGNSADWCGAMARAGDPGKPSRQPAVLGTREGACSCQGLCCHLSAGQAPDHSHESLEAAALAGAGCPPSSPLPPLPRVPSPLPPSALPQARHGDTSPTCLKAVLELDEAESYL